MLANRRCVVPAEGFYEWREENGRKQPYFFARRDGKPVMFAGIWDYSDVKGEAIPSFAILTDEPNELVAPYHDCMTRFSTVEIDFVADDPGPSLLHCHHQDHQDEGFMGMMTYL